MNKMDKSRYDEILKEIEEFTELSDSNSGRPIFSLVLDSYFSSSVSYPDSSIGFSIYNDKKAIRTFYIEIYSIMGIKSLAKRNVKMDKAYAYYSFDSNYLERFCLKWNASKGPFFIGVDYNTISIYMKTAIDIKPHVRFALKCYEKMRIDYNKKVEIIKDYENNLFYEDPVGALGKIKNEPRKLKK